MNWSFLLPVGVQKSGRYPANQTGCDVYAAQQGNLDLPGLTTIQNH